MKWIEKKILTAADSIIVTAEGDKENIIRKNISSNKIHLIYNGADTQIFSVKSEKEKIEILKKYKLPQNKNILIYFGSFNYGMNDIEALADSLVYLREKEIRFFLYCHWRWN